MFSEVTKVESGNVFNNNQLQGSQIGAVQKVGYFPSIRCAYQLQMLHWKMYVHVKIRLWPDYVHVTEFQLSDVVDPGQHFFEHFGRFIVPLYTYLGQVAPKVRNEHFLIRIVDYLVLELGH